MFRRFLRSDKITTDGIAKIPTHSEFELAYIPPVFEYKVVEGYRSNISESLLNTLGKDGFELISCCIYHDTLRYVFKRRIE